MTMTSEIAECYFYNFPLYIVVAYKSLETVLRHFTSKEFQLHVVHWHSVHCEMDDVKTSHSFKYLNLLYIYLFKYKYI